MKDAATQSAVTAKVQATFVDFPALGLVPDYDGSTFTVQVLVNSPAEEPEYVTALYELFNKDPNATLIGRDGLMIYGA